MNFNLTEEVVTAQQSFFSTERSTDLTNLSIREAGDLVRRKVISPSNEFAVIDDVRESHSEAEECSNIVVYCKGQNRRIR